MRTNTFLQAFISQSVHLPSENYDPPLTSISSRQWEEFFAKASCACYKIAGSCKNCDKLEFMFREKIPLHYASDPPSSNKEIVGREDQPQIVQRRASGQNRHCADRLVIVVISIKVSNHQLPQYHPTLKLTLSLGKCLYFSSDSTESFSCHMDSSISKSISLSLSDTHTEQHQIS